MRLAAGLERGQFRSGAGVLVASIGARLEGTLEEVAGARIRVVKNDGRTQEMTREAAVMAALRKLASRE